MSDVLLQLEDVTASVKLGRRQVLTTVFAVRLMQLLGSQDLERRALYLFWAC